MLVRISERMAGNLASTLALLARKRGMRRNARQRVKLWALPASTLMMLPVDFADMSETRK